MDFSLVDALQILSTTPIILTSQLSGLSENWARIAEGENTWSPYDVVGHLIHGEKTDWMCRVNIILTKGTSETFQPFDRFAQFENSKGKSLVQLLGDFESLRESNLDKLNSLKINKSTLKLKGMHPEFGEITLSELLSTWVVHDLGHLNQINRVLATRYMEEVGPWKEYLGILKSK